MDAINLVLVSAGLASLFILALNRAAFPYLLVFVLGLEYLSPGTPDSLLTIPKVGLAILVASQVLTRRYTPVIWIRGLLLPAIVFSGFMALTVIWSVDPGRSFIRAISLALLLIAFSVVQSSVRSVQDLRHYWRAFIFYALASAIVAAYQMFTGWMVFQAPIGARVGGLGVNPSEGAFYMSIGLLVVLALHLNKSATGFPKSLSARLMILGALSVGVLMTSSRGGILALIGAIAMLAHSVQSSQGKGRSFGRLLPFAFVAMIVTILVPDLLEHFSLRISNSLDDRLGNRLDIWEFMWSSIRARPVLGSGLHASLISFGTHGDFSTYSSHNTPFGILMDGGLVGLLLFGFVTVRVFNLVGRIRRDSNPEIRLNGDILAAILVLASMLMLTHDMFFIKLFWTILALLEATGLLVKRSSSISGGMLARARQPSSTFRSSGQLPAR